MQESGVPDKVLKAKVVFYSLVCAHISIQTSVKKVKYK